MPPLDNTMSLTERQKQIVINSFLKVEPIAPAAATIFYDKLFEYDPSLKPLFKSNLNDQGKMLMSALKVAVNSLHNLDRLVPVLEKMAIQHVEYGVKCDDYTPVGNALIYTLKQGLGNDFNSELKDAWAGTYKIMATVMRQAAYPDYNPDTYKNTKNYNR